MTSSNRDAVLGQVREQFSPEVGRFADRTLRPAVACVLRSRATSRSRFGGLPDLAEGEEWPVYGEPGQFVGQIDLAELPPGIRLAHELPADGLLRIFVPAPEDQEEFFWGDPGFVRTLFTREPVRRAEAWPEGMDEDLVCDAVAVELEDAWDLPAHAELSDDWPFADTDTDTDEDRYLRFVATLRPAERLFGHTDFTTLAYDPTPAGTVPFLTLPDRPDLRWEWGGGGFLQTFLAPAALARGDFSEVASDAG